MQLIDKLNILFLSANEPFFKKTINKILLLVKKGTLKLEENKIYGIIKKGNRQLHLQTTMQDNNFFIIIADPKKLITEYISFIEKDGEKHIHYTIESSHKSFQYEADYDNDDKVTKQKYTSKKLFIHNKNSLVHTIETIKTFYYEDDLILLTYERKENKNNITKESERIQAIINEDDNFIIISKEDADRFLLSQNTLHEIINVKVKSLK